MQRESLTRFLKYNKIPKKKLLKINDANAVNDTEYINKYIDK